MKILDNYIIKKYLITKHNKKKIKEKKNKTNKIENIGYILTPSGISERTKLTINFMN